MTSAVLSDKINESRGRCHLGRKCPGIVVRNDVAGLGRSRPRVRRTLMKKGGLMAGTLSELGGA